MNAHSVDYVKDSYLEEIQPMQIDTTDASLKHCLRILQLQGTTQEQTQQSMARHRKARKEGSSNFEAKNIPQTAYETRDTT